MRKYDICNNSGDMKFVECLITYQLQALQEHQAALLTLQQKAQDQLKEARATQVSVVLTLYHHSFGRHLVSLFIIFNIICKALLLYIWYLDEIIP